MTRALAAALLAAWPWAAAAEGLPPVATLAVDNGSLPPAHRRDLRVGIGAGGHVVLRACRGYAEAGPGCVVLEGQAAEGAVAAILAAAEAAGVFDRPPRRAERFPVGGGTTSVTVARGGETVLLPPFPAAEDAARVAAVLAAIAAAVPADLMAAARAAHPG